MSQAQRVRRFRANPVEVAIFSIVTLVFTHSVYSLFYDTQSFYPGSFMSRSYASAPPSRDIASASASLSALTGAASQLELDFKCEGSVTQETGASKVRISGPLCGMNETSTAGRLVRATIENKKNQFQATVFTDIYHGKFSTDYIPIETGDNQIKLEFRYFDGSSSVAEVTLKKTSTD